VELNIRNMDGSRAFLQDRNTPAFRMAKRAIEIGFGSAPAEILQGGSIPIVRLIHESLGIPVVIMGFGLPEENTHAPDENFDLENFRKGIRTSACLMEELAR
jgi:acetylornithine deacetylase/succinyl-diaminopimelate desuccinylase-like protein